MSYASIHLDAKKSAYQIVDSLWRGRGFPVDPHALAEQMGVTVLAAELPENIAGGLVKDAGKAAIMLLNQAGSVDFKRFNCAQKLGYHVCQTQQHVECYKYVEFHQRLGAAGDGAGAGEIFADAFAASLLMPDLAVRQLARKGMALAGMAGHFGVTVAAMEDRLKQLGIDLEQIVAA